MYSLEGSNCDNFRMGKARENAELDNSSGYDLLYIIYVILHRGSQLRDVSPLTLSLSYYRQFLAPLSPARNSGTNWAEAENLVIVTACFGLSG